MENMINKSGISIPLFSFNTIIDTDLGLLNYVFKEFRNEELFDLNVLDYNEFINKVYYRNFRNPLYVLMRDQEDNEKKKFLDECYEEFLVEKEKEIIQNSVSTQLAELLKMFIADSSIRPYIMCYSDMQADFLLNIPDFIGCTLIMIDGVIPIAKKTFSQYYFKYVEELYPFNDIVDRTFYISNCGLNLNEDRTDIKIYEPLETLLQRNTINVIELYREDIIGKDIYLYGNNDS